ncbi:unnamed protein product, partial [Dibothriocephalus latus]
MATRRYTDPVYLQFIWDALEAPTAGRPYTFECIFDFVRTEKDPKCNPGKLRQELANSVRDRCISVNGGQYRKTDWSDLPTKGKHDCSWSFRPCKVLHESSDGYEVICFDGRREREFIPSHSAVDMNFTASELGLRMTASLKKALEEAERYKKNQMLRSSGKE